MELQGRIDDTGKPLIYGRADLDNWFAARKGKDFKMEIKLIRGQRSNPQNRWYWGCIVPTMQRLINQFGQNFTADETHEYLKAEFNYKEIEVTEGHFIKVPRSTTELDKTDFTVYADKIIAFAAQMFGENIPLPEEQLPLNYQYDTALNTHIISKAS